MSDIKEILENLGYILTPDNNGWRSNCVYREGDNPTALKIYPDGNWTDFVESKHGKFEELIALTLGNKTIDEAKEWLNNKDYQFNNKTETLNEPLIKNENKIFSPQFIQDFGIVPNYNYWISRGISENTAKLFRGGLAYRDKLKNRQVLIIYNSKEQIVGFTGRSVLKDYKIKWKHLGIKKNWVFPAYLNSKIIQEKKEVILVESPVCVLKMWDCGIDNVICLFGLEISFPIINFLLRLNDIKILISTNNEESNRGNDAALKIERKLARYFDKRNIIIKLPFKKDFGEMDKDSIISWKDS